MESHSFDVVVVGSGHAGCEAALIAAHLGVSVCVVSLAGSRAGHMPCNCSIGGPAKGHLVREIDALGGQMALGVDSTFTHIRNVGTGKGYAIRTLRAQVDKVLYERHMTAALAAGDRIRLIPDEVIGVLTDSRGVTGVVTASGIRIGCRAAVLTTGTYLNGLMHCGDRRSPGGCFGGGRAERLSDALRALGLVTARFKTGTTPRVRRSSIQWDQVLEIPSESTEPFSYLTGQLTSPQHPLPCWQTRTTLHTRDLIVANLTRSALFGGMIQGIGPRYCPSIEDKIVRFPDKATHPVFLEIEGWDSDLVYVQGMSTSLPADVQDAMLRSLPGLANVEMVRPGYAVEYDMVMPDQLTGSLQCKELPGLFLAGQINGTSGYEEAAAQGLVAGVNAARLCRGDEPIILDRHSSYIGVLIDDLTTKGVQDPYRLLTSRAECRLSLRHDNADIRLTPLAIRIGTATDRRKRVFEQRVSSIERETARLASMTLHPRDSRTLTMDGLAPIVEPTSLLDLLRRPEVSYDWIRDRYPAPEFIPRDVGESIEIEAKYAGYVERQRRHVELHARDDSLPLPADLDYNSVRGISREAAEKLSRSRPLTVGHARRIPGVTPADVRILAVAAMGISRNSELAARPVKEP